jgi:hypothetical protein
MDEAMKKNRIWTGILAGVLMLAGLMFTASTANAQHIGVGIGVGGVGVAVGPGYPGYYAPPPVYAAPYPGYLWNPGYYNPYGVWVGGFWGPRYGYGYRGGYYGGYGRGFVGARGGFVGGRGFVGARGGFAGGRGGGHR